MEFGDIWDGRLGFSDVGSWGKMKRDGICFGLGNSMNTWVSKGWLRDIYYGLGCSTGIGVYY